MVGKGKQYAAATFRYFPWRKLKDSRGKWIP
jgi:hypothetical protein